MYVRAYLVPLQLVDYRVEFSKWWTTEFKHIKFPSQGTVFDYFLDPNTHKWLPWSEKVPKFELDPDAPLQVYSIEIHVETISCLPSSLSLCLRLFWFTLRRQ